MYPGKISVHEGKTMIPKFSRAEKKKERQLESPGKKLILHEKVIVQT